MELEEQYIIFTFQNKEYKLKGSTTFGQLFDMEFKSFLCCGKKKFDQMKWKQYRFTIHPAIDGKICQTIFPGDIIQCYEPQKKQKRRRSFQEIFFGIHYLTMQTGLNGSDFSEVFAENNSISQEVQFIIQQAL